MSTSILEVRGIGPSTVAILAENGIVTAEDLATKTIRQVTIIKGFSEIRAAQVIADAKALVSPESKQEIKKTKSEKKAVKKEKIAKKTDKNKSKVKEKEKKAKKTVKSDKKNKKMAKGKKGGKTVKKSKK